jgi:hypothetical protein
MLGKWAIVNRLSKIKTKLSNYIPSPQIPKHFHYLTERMVYQFCANSSCLSNSKAGDRFQQLKEIRKYKDH